ncbi:MAG: succinyl-diaminopimelate desuccinylase [Legionellales bacterium RIFCSPHIGHO2_12_FULL_37_14]|nr:MAG: succinyl-diaminopimelate desuccinylase [Legionellales bacterium RIFCSPHIGHO2_12_FULL_37_14]
MTSAKDLLSDLIAFESISPDDAGCSLYLINKLEKLGFTVKTYPKGLVMNFYAKVGEGTPTLIFAGHTDVVPSGASKNWLSHPFTLLEQNNKWIGRGVADMKGALVAMLLMAERLTKTKEKLKASFGFLITSGEEGNYYNDGTPYLMQQLFTKTTKPKYCIVGEPSSNKQVGDTIKIGRRGSLNALVTIKGKQGHVAYPKLADNPIHKASLALAKLANLSLDKGNEYFPPSSLQITDLHAGANSNNVIPGELQLNFNIRYSNEQTIQKLKNTVMGCFTQFNLEPHISWQLSGEPFLTASGQLLATTKSVIKKTLGKEPILSTDGGTSDGRFIAPYGIEVIELGLCNHSIHQINESIGINEIEKLTFLYTQITSSLC